MAFVTCGLNHRTAPINIRECVAWSLDEQIDHLKNFHNESSFKETIILSTCNRTEIYCETDDIEAVATWFANSKSINIEQLRPHLYIKSNEDAVHHLLRVATGLDSMMLGEPQILGQLKKAYQQAYALNAVKEKLSFIFPFIFKASKRIRHQSNIGRNPVSIAYTAVQLIGQHCRDYASLQVLLIGSGETANLVAKYLTQKGVQQFMIASRTAQHASRLAASLNGQALDITDLAHYLPKADVIISATACPLPFISPNMVQQALSHRNHAPMFFLDLAIPRDIEPTVAKLNHITLYNIDDLQHILALGREEKESCARIAEALIDEEMNNYGQHLKALNATNLICDYRQKMQLITQEELKRATSQLIQGKCQHQVLNQFSERLLNKLTHQPTVGLRLAALQSHEALLDLAKYLFTHSEKLQTHEEIS